MAEIAHMPVAKLILKAEKTGFFIGMIGAKDRLRIVWIFQKKSNANFIFSLRLYSEDLKANEKIIASQFIVCNFLRCALCHDQALQHLEGIASSPNLAR